jgi:hypothetical protein
MFAAHVALHFIERGKPTQNALIESFNGKFREERLNQNWFVDLRHAREVIETWRVDYNTVRPHSSLGYQTPEEFAASATGVSPTPVAATTLVGAKSSLREAPSANLMTGPETGGRSISACTFRGIQKVQIAQVGISC